jgi:hypothetical protein
MENTARNKFYPTFNDSVRLIIRVFIVSFFVGVPVATVWLILRDGFDVQSELIDSLVLLIVYAVPLILVSRLGVKRIRIRNDNDYSLNWKLPNAVNLLVIVVTCISVTVVMDPLDSLMPVPEEYVDMMKNMAKPNVFSFLSIVVAAPLLEEIFFRGIILEGFLKNYSPKKAILLSAAIFGAIHLNPWQASGAFLIGILIGWLYWKTRSLMPGIIIHFVNNAIAFFVILNFSGEIQSIRAWIGNSTTYWVVVGVSALLLIAGIYFMNRKLGTTSEMKKETV